MKLPSALLLSAVVAVAAAGPAMADSIWARRGPNHGYLFIDRTARKVGDVLTVLILESTQIENEETREMDKKTGASAQLTGHIPSTITVPLATWNHSSSNSFGGDTTYDVDRDFRDRVTAVVVDVLPNGNLVIEGRRERVVAGDKRSTYLAGIVRPDDIGAGNTILSERIAQFHLVYEGKGYETRFLNPNWFSRVFNVLWPF